MSSATSDRTKVASATSRPISIAQVNRSGRGHDDERDQPEDRAQDQSQDEAPAARGRSGSKRPPAARLRCSRRRLHLVTIRPPALSGVRPLRRPPGLRPDGGPAGHSGRERRDPGGAPVPGRLPRQVPVARRMRFSYQKTPSRSRPARRRTSVSAAPATCLVRSDVQPASARSSSTHPAPAPPPSRPMWIGDAGSAGTSRQSSSADRTCREPDAGAAGGVQVLVVARGAGRLQVRPGDAGGAELEPRCARRVAVRHRPVQPAGRSRDRLRHAPIAAAPGRRRDRPGSPSWA